MHNFNINNINKPQYVLYVKIFVRLFTFLLRYNMFIDTLSNLTMIPTLYSLYSFISTARFLVSIVKKKIVPFLLLLGDFVYSSRIFYVKMVVEFYVNMKIYFHGQEMTKLLACLKFDTERVLKKKLLVVHIFEKYIKGDHF